MNKIVSIAALLLALSSRNGFAQDPVKVDPKHYKVEFENDKVRVLRITYAPGEKSVMHGHPDGVAVFLSDFSGKFAFPNGKLQEMTGKAGQAIWSPGAKHLPENIGNKPFELVLIELKTKTAKTK